MSITFAYRSDTLTARYGLSGTDYGTTGNNAVSIVGDSLAIGGNALNQGNPATQDGIAFAGNLNVPQTAAFSVLQRVKFFAPAASNNTLFSFMLTGRVPQNGLECQMHPSGQVVHWQYQGSLVGMNSIGVAFNPTAGVYYDLAWTWGGVQNTATFQFFVDGVTMGVLTPTRNHSQNVGMGCSQITLGYGEKWHQSNMYVNEFVLWNEIIDVQNVTLTGSVGALSGTSRTDFVEVDALDGTSSVDPGAANVVDGTAYTIKGISLTGTFAVADYTDPGVANVLSGTGYVFNDATLTGTYHDADYTDPGIGSVAIGTEYIFNDATLTGTLSVPTPSTGTAATVPLGELKEQIRYVLNANNTATGAPIGDLSDGLTRRVQMILKVNPEKIPPNDNILPALTVFIDSKSTAPESIARNGATGKRKAEISLKIAGMVWEPYTDNRIEDPADEDLEKLMENAEKILRGYDSLSGNVSWQFPTQITYHSLGWDEKAHYRGSIMDIKAILFY